jgi:hypothetical protein
MGKVRKIYILKFKVYGFSLRPSIILGEGEALGGKKRLLSPLFPRNFTQ